MLHKKRHPPHHTINSQQSKRSDEPVNTLLNSKSVTNFTGASQFEAVNHSKSHTNLNRVTNVQNSPQTFFLTAENSCTNSTSSSSLSSLNNNNKNTAESYFNQMGDAATKVSSSSQSSLNTNTAENYYSSSLISDYRLTLTDLIELNLIDVTNGLIINPVNGARLTVADAIRIDLLNSDVKEVANTFLRSNSDTTKTKKSSSCIKLTVKEAIQMSVLNANKNEIHLSKSNQTLKLNLYEAKRRNLILKPLTLSEAFIRNLIQPNGFVRNPINNMYYAFESLIAHDLKSLCCCENNRLG